MSTLSSTNIFHILIFLIAIGLLSCNESDPSLTLLGLLEDVEVIRDSTGINHIYAQNQQDLFYTQGYLAAKDRLFQFEIWRRQATGTVAEILGPRELQRDIGTRLFQFRGDMKTEMNYYHDEGEELITAYVDGVNAYVQEVLDDRSKLPVTLKALDLLPGKWTPEVVVSRHQGLLGNIEQELEVGRVVSAVGPHKAKEYYWFHPKDPNLNLDPSITSEMLSKDILGIYQAYRKPVEFLPSDILPEYRTENFQSITVATPAEEDRDFSLGSNNWVTRPRLGAEGHGFMANDPHRRLAVPSLRYMVHLVAPGWNVIGGGEPEIPGVSIGHNEYGAWGLTVFRTDGEDLYVYDLNPENLNEYQHEGDWKEMQVIPETFKVKGEEDVSVDLRYTVHGPVTFIDSAHLKAYAVRCAWMEPGGAPYLASLRMDQAKNWEEFREACAYSHIPGENMVWADPEGNIGWQSVGIAPIRRNFSGLVPVPGDGRFEWEGYLPIKEKPNVYNPEEGFFATANQNVTPETYDKWEAIGFSWSDPFRGDRVNEVLAAGDPLTMEKMQSLQTDYLSIPARILVPRLADLSFQERSVQAAQELLAPWDFRLSINSAEATIYVAWEEQLRERIFEFYPDPEVEQWIGTIQLSRVLHWILDPSGKFGGKKERDLYLRRTFQYAVEELQQRLGPNMENWNYGQAKMKHVQISHPLGSVVSNELAEELNTPLMPRGGNQFTPGSTSGNLNQSSGASFRVIIDVNDWDASVGTNTPGQSGDPESKFYMNLFESWANDEFFPLYFSKGKVLGNSWEQTVYSPLKE